jgi:hypothetical protein
MNEMSSATGIVMIGMSALGHVPQEQQHDEDDDEDDLDERLADVVDGAADQLGAVVDGTISTPSGRPGSISAIAP